MLVRGEEFVNIWVEEAPRLDATVRAINPGRREDHLHDPTLTRFGLYVDHGLPGHRRGSRPADLAATTQGEVGRRRQGRRGRHSTASGHAVPRIRSRPAP